MAEAKSPILKLKTNLRQLRGFPESLGQLRRSLPEEYEKTPPPYDPKLEDIERVTRAMSSTQGVMFGVHEAMLGQSPDKIVKTVGSILSQVAVSGTGLHLVRGFTVDMYPTATRNLKNGLVIQSDNGSATLRKGTYYEGIRSEGTSNLINSRSLPGKESDVKGKLVVSTFTEEIVDSKLGPEIGIYPDAQMPGLVETTYLAEREGLPYYDRKIRKDLGPNPKMVTSSNLPGSSMGLKGKLVVSTFTEEIVDSKLGPEIGIYPDAQPSGLIETTYLAEREGVPYYREKIRKDLGPNPKMVTSSNLPGSSMGPEGNTLDRKLRLGGNYRTDKSNRDNLGVIEVSDVTNEASMREILGADIIPFEFQIITPTRRKILYFRALLDKFSDGFDGEINSEKYVGRAEDFYNYRGFSRKISFSFKAAAFYPEHLQPLYDKLNALAGATAPSYGGGGQFMRATLGRITIGDYFHKQHGMFSSVNFEWDTGTPWEIEEESTDGTGTPINVLRVPHILTVNVQFLPIHTFNVQESSRFFGFKS